MVPLSPRRCSSTSNLRCSEGRTLRGVRVRVALAAAAGAAAAAAGHAMDVAGQLPFVEEAEHVRTAMTPTMTVGWLALAALLAGTAAATRVVAVGVPAAVLVSGFPELWGRHDLGAVAEPGALLGALLQVLLLLAIVAAALLVQDRLTNTTAAVVLSRPTRPPLPLHPVRRATRTTVVRRSRAPPASASH